MKNLLGIFIVCLILNSCSDAKISEYFTPKVKTIPVTESVVTEFESCAKTTRIIIVDEGLKNNPFYIVSVDSIEYLVNGHGGIIKLK